MPSPRLRRECPRLKGLVGIERCRHCRYRWRMAHHHQSRSRNTILRRELQPRARNTVRTPQYVRARPRSQRQPCRYKNKESSATPRLLRRVQHPSRIRHPCFQVTHRSQRVQYQSRVRRPLRWANHFSRRVLPHEQHARGNAPDRGRCCRGFELRRTAECRGKQRAIPAAQKAELNGTRRSRSPYLRGDGDGRKPQSRSEKDRSGGAGGWK